MSFRSTRDFRENFCKMLVMNKNSSIRASPSPTHIRFPENNKQKGRVPWTLCLELPQELCHKKYLMNDRTDGGLEGRLEGQMDACYSPTVFTAILHSTSIYWVAGLHQAPHYVFPTALFPIWHSLSLFPSSIQSTIGSSHTHSSAISNTPWRLQLYLMLFPSVKRHFSYTSFRNYVLHHFLSIIPVIPLGRRILPSLGFLN